MPNLLVVLGPTASGKTRLGVELALRLGGEVISADSRQVYRGLDLGAGKDLDAYEAGGRRVPHHLIDCADLSEEFSVYHFQRAFYAAFETVRQRARLPVLVGGTGLYLESVLLDYPLVESKPDPVLRAELARLDSAVLAEGLLRLKPDLHNRTDLDNRERLVRAVEIALAGKTGQPAEHPRLEAYVAGLRWNRDRLRERIARRLRERLAAGMIAEVAGLHERGVSWERLRSLGLEYRHVADFLLGAIRSEEDLFRRLALEIGRLAKRQETWFRRMERRGIRIHWVSGEEMGAAADEVENGLKSAGTSPA
ncbi:MAG: tRNA (adenosine(37)-N6)-dimethylallyltransferase MiaA [candidate division FCPU426 bacterium]